jgi:hypothetical protein
MYKAIIFKELRETAWIALLAAGAFAVSILGLIGYGLLSMSNERPATVPFADGRFVDQLGIIAAVFAIVLGWRQAAWESLRGTSVFLLHRPIARGMIFAIKLAVGLGLLLTTTGLAVLAYAAWAARPGTHASPFYWSMTIDSWLMWLGMTAVYLGAFTAGIRPGRYFGSRLFPLVAALLPIMACTLELPVAMRIAFVIFVDALGLATIAYVTQSRDYP